MNWKLYFSMLNFTFKGIGPVAQMGWWLLVVCATMTGSMTLFAKSMSPMASQIAIFLINLMETLFTTAYASYYFGKWGGQPIEGNFRDHTAKVFGPFIYETFRVMGKALLYSFLLILPGLYKMVQLAPYSFEVFWGPSREDEPDVVKNSIHSMRGLVIPGICLLLIILSIYLGSQILPGYFSGIGQIIVFFLVKFFNTVLFVFYTGSFYSMYRLQRQGSLQLSPEELK